MRKKREKNPKSIGVGPIFAWQSREVSHGICMMILAYLSIYCTDTLNMDPYLVGMLLVLSKLLDGVTDIFAGYLVDRTNTKIGRGRPYELCIVGLWFCTWLMYSCSPSWSLVVKCAWVICTYTLVNSIFFTFLNANATVYMVRAFKYEEQYVALNSYGRIISMICVAAFNIIAPSLVAKYAVNASGWSRMVAMIAVPMAIIGLMRFLFIKETNQIDVSSVNGKNTKVRLKDVKMVLTKNPYIYIVALILFIQNFVSNMGVNVYYFKYVAKDLNLLGVVNATMLLAIPLAALFPRIIRRFSKGKLILAGCIITAAGYLLNFFAEGNPVLLSIAGIMYGGGITPITTLVPLLIIDCADYNEWNGMQRMEGTLGCVTGLATKIGSALGAGVLGILLSLSGYVGDAAQIPESAIYMIRSLFSIIPMILWLVISGSLLFYKLDGLIPKIRGELEARRAQNQN